MWFDGGPFVIEFARLADNGIGLTDDMHHDFGRIKNSWVVGKATNQIRSDGYEKQQVPHQSLAPYLVCFRILLTS